MEKFNQRGEIPVGFLVLIGYFAGLGIGSIIHSSDAASTSSAVRSAQMYNADVNKQLEANYQRVEDLYVDPDVHNFNFNTVGANGQAEVCKGQFKITKDTAQVAGKIACTFNSELSR